MSDELREKILKTCFEKCNTRFAGGERANNKLDLEKIADSPALREQVGEQIALLVKNYNPDLIIGVPQGANWLAGDVARYLNIPKILLNKSSQTKIISFGQEEDKSQCEKASRIVVVEDVFNKYTSTRRVLALPMIGDRTVAVISIWDRGREKERRPLAVASKSLIKFPIAAQLSEESSLWKYAQGK